VNDGRGFGFWFDWFFVEREGEINELIVRFRDWWHAFVFGGRGGNSLGWCRAIRENRFVEVYLGADHDGSLLGVPQAIGLGALFVTDKDHWFHFGVPSGSFFVERPGMATKYPEIGDIRHVSV